MVLKHSCNLRRMNQSDRIRYAMHASGKSPAELAAACGVSVQAVYKWLKDPLMNLRNEHLFAAADLMRFEPRWMATGQGFPRAALDDAEKALLDQYRASGPAEKIAITQVAETLSRPYRITPQAVAHNPEVTQVTPDADQIRQNLTRHPDAHLHIKTYTAGRPETGQKKAAGGKPAAGE